MHMAAVLHQQGSSVRVSKLFSEPVIWCQRTEFGSITIPMSTCGVRNVQGFRTTLTGVLTDLGTVFKNEGTLRQHL